MHEDFATKGITFTVESTFETPPKEEIQMDVQKIDAFYNPEYDKIVEQAYKHPVFFKSLPYGLTYEEQGFIDNGRQVIPFGSEYEMAEKASMNRGSSINEFAYDEKAQQ